MTIELVHEARPGCQPHCAEWIAMQGKIVAGTAQAFARVLRRLGDRRVPIAIDSLGGSVNDALAMGRLIRAHQLDVIVTRSIAASCPAGAVCGKGEETRGASMWSIGALCASACPLVLAAGVHRDVGPGASVGVHEIIETGTRTWKRPIYRIFARRLDDDSVEVTREHIGDRTVSVEHLTIEGPPGVYRRISAYLEGMGVSAKLVPLMRETPHRSIHWLTRDEQRSMALVTTGLAGGRDAAPTAGPTRAEP